MNERFAVDVIGQDKVGSYRADKPVSKVLVADDHESVRNGVRELIKTERAFEVCGEATDGREAVEKARQLKPDIVVIDVSMPELNGIEATRQIVKDDASAEVLVLTVYESEQIVDEILNAGARGYLLKSDVAYDLLFAIASLSQHRPFFTSKVASMVLQGYLENSARSGGCNVSALTSREREVVQLLAEGKSNKEVAVIQGIEVKTAETHRANLMRKLGLHSVCDLVHYAVRNQIIEA
ncbi:MAG TPA: response regulator transcription factor [Terriglobia bacterium]|nr:response regulator transcription factor [Terriglobia bacterium]